MMIRLIADVTDYPVAYGATKNSIFEVEDTLKKGTIVLVTAKNGKKMWIAPTEYEMFEG